ncbi:hypothetical protein BV25DRAFT_1471435 [Artomyces pyxidatus]|uniref:Uncharacterized protein n=1 Tax=Artomyces pyxidatus TaxID=48021 RepID=A0ACB8SKM9_9AGAM|nr:hypothetical protein BV25DRAFT_1471435 [Artomyces pyxidatus]
MAGYETFQARLDSTPHSALPSAKSQHSHLSTTCKCDTTKSTHRAYLYYTSFFFTANAGKSLLVHPPVDLVIISSDLSHPVIRINIPYILVRVVPVALKMREWRREPRSQRPGELPLPRPSPGFGCRARYVQTPRTTTGVVLYTGNLASMPTSMRWGYDVVGARGTKGITTWNVTGSSEPMDRTTFPRPPRMSSSASLHGSHSILCGFGRR